MECASTFFLVFLNVKSSILAILHDDLIAANSVCSACMTASENKMLAFFIKYLCNLCCQVLSPL